MERESTDGVTIGDTRESGIPIRCKERDVSRGQMGGSSLESTRTTKSMDMVSFSGWMGNVIKESG
jgi:hypothetical protein